MKIEYVNTEPTPVFQDLASGLVRTKNMEAKDLVRFTDHEVVYYWRKRLKLMTRDSIEWMINGSNRGIYNFLFSEPGGYGSFDGNYLTYRIVSPNTQQYDDFLDGFDTIYKARKIHKRMQPVFVGNCLRNAPGMTPCN